MTITLECAVKLIILRSYRCPYIAEKVFTEILPVGGVVY